LLAIQALPQNFGGRETKSQKAENSAFGAAIKRGRMPRPPRMGRKAPNRPLETFLRENQGRGGGTGQNGLKREPGKNLPRWILGTGDYL